MLSGVTDNVYFIYSDINRVDLFELLAYSSATLYPSKIPDHTDSCPSLLWRVLWRNAQSRFRVHTGCDDNLVILFPH